MNPMERMEKKTGEMIKAVHKRDGLKGSTGKRPRAPVNLLQPYTSGDVVNMAKEATEKKEEEIKAKKRKQEEKAKLKEERENQMQIRKKEAEKRRMKLN